MSTPTKSFCSVCSKAAGVSPGGTAWAVNHFIIMELPLPWPEDPLDARSVPPGVRETLLSLWDEEVPIGLFAVAPDADYSVPNKTRILSFDFGAGRGGPAKRCDFLTPTALAAATIDALARKQPLHEKVEIDDTPYRDAMICTHGSRDACCATFGFPLYRKLRGQLEERSNVRIWRATHFGGHRFAPTMMTFPDGRSWGYLDRETGHAILERSGPAGEVLQAYRGWSGYEDDAVQLLEQEALARVGWDWLDYRQEGRVVSCDEESGSKRVEIIAESPTGDRIELRGEVVQVDQISVRGSCDGDDYPTPRFAVRDVEFRSLAPVALVH